MNYQRLLLLATVFAVLAFLALVLRIAHPHHRQLALALYGIGWVPFVLSIRQFWVNHDGDLSRIWQWKIHFAVGLSLLMMAWVFRVLIPVEKSPLRAVDLAALPASVEADLDRLTLLDENMQDASAALLAEPAVESPQLTSEQRQQLRSKWADFIEASFELDVLKNRYRAFYQVNGFRYPKLHAHAFLVAYGAFVSQYRAAVIVTTKYGQRESIKKFLDDAHQDAGLPAGSFARLQSLVSHPDEILRLNAGRAYLQLMKRRLDKNDVGVLRTEDQLSEVTRLVMTDTDAFVSNPLDLLEHHASRAWYPVQKGVALSMASVRTVNRDYFISSAEIEADREQLLPGDIMLTRREWHMTNLGIPGYWTHAALHIGSLAQLDEYYKNHSESDGPLPSTVIRETFPSAYEVLADGHGTTQMVIEAMRPGVIVQPLHVSATADSLAVLRPNVAEADRWRAVLAALVHFGKPYNYQFDFRTESALVCSQLVCKAYEAMPDLGLVPAMSGGRLLFSPNEFAIKYDRELGKRNHGLELVLFLDGIDQGNVVRRGAEEFRRSWSRPKWHIVFE